MENATEKYTTIGVISEINETIVNIEDKITLILQAEPNMKAETVANPVPHTLLRAELEGILTRLNILYSRIEL